MSQESAIEWTDATWNPVTGCMKVSPGCANCYAEGVAERFWATQYPLVPHDLRGELEMRPRVFTDVQSHPNRLDQPLHWRQPRKVFVNSMSDLFHEDVSDAFIDQVFAVMALAPEHTFQVLTKRAERMRAYMAGPNRYDAIVEAMDMPSWLPSGRRFPRIPENWPIPNVWLGMSTENQRCYDTRVSLLLSTPAAVRFISVEPMLEAIYLRLRNDGSLMNEERQTPRLGLDWVIVGGESGPSARPFELAWARSIVQQCKLANVPVFVKQLGSDARTGYYDDAARDVIEQAGGDWPDPIGWCEHDGQPNHADLVALKLRKKGGDMTEWPVDLRIRQFPLTPSTREPGQ